MKIICDNCNSPTNTMKISIIFLLLITLISCEKKDDLPGMNFDEETYNENRYLWQESGIMNYTFSQEYHSQSIGGQPELNTVVRNNELVSIIVKSSGEDIRSDGFIIYYNNINDLYDFIDKIVKDAYWEINSSDNSMRGATIEVEYDETYHIPTKISCTGYYRPDIYGGLSITIAVNDFTID